MRGAEELLEWAPKSCWSGLQRAVGVGSKELLARGAEELLEWAPKSYWRAVPKSYWSGLQRAVGVAPRSSLLRFRCSPLRADMVSSGYSDSQNVDLWTNLTKSSFFSTLPVFFLHEHSSAVQSQTLFAQVRTLPVG